MTLRQIVDEEIKQPPKRDELLNIIKKDGQVLRGGTGLVVWDIDDSLLKADSKNIKIWKKENGKETPLSTDEFAKDSGKDENGRPKPGVEYSYREFRDPVKVRNSIINGTPLINNLHALDAYINAGYDFCFLTARGLEEVVKSSIDEFLKYRDSKGNLKSLGKVFKKDISVAVNDSKYDEVNKGLTDGEKKARVLKELCGKYDNVVFFDDDINNVKASRALGLKNLKVVNIGGRK